MLIPLAHGEYSIIDDEDYEKISKRSWHCTSDGYVFSGLNDPSKSFYMHRLIMGLSYKDGKSVDHINGNKLDNRKSNLRLCTQVQNNGNYRLPNRNHSGYKGVCWNKRDRKYRVQIQCNGKLFFLGYFDDPIEGAFVYDKKAIELFGEFANTNFPIKE